MKNKKPLIHYDIALTAIEPQPYCGQRLVQPYNLNQCTTIIKYVTCEKCRSLLYVDHINSGCTEPECTWCND